MKNSGWSKGVTYEQVAGIAEKMVQKGEKPKEDSIRNEIGYGSISTIHKHLKKWKTEYNKKSPKENVFTTDIQIAIYKEIDRRIQGFKDEHFSEISALEKIEKELIAEKDFLSCRVSDLTNQTEILKGELSSIEGKASLLKNENEKLKEEIKKELEKARTDIERERTISQQSRMEAAEAIVRYEGNIEAVKVISSEKQELLKKIDAQAERIDNEKEKTEKVKIENVRLSEKNSSLQSSLQQLEKNYSDLEKSNRQLKEQIVLENERKERVHNDFQKELQKQINEKDNIIKEKNKQIDTLCKNKKTTK